MTGQVVRDVAEVPPGRSVVTVGFFDGVHKGHQEIVGRAVSEAAERPQTRAVAVTFDRHPLEVVRPGSVPRYLQSLDDRISTLLDQGLDLVLVVTFDQDFSELEPGDFAGRILRGPVGAEHVVVGENFRFGHRAAGDVDRLRQIGAVHGFTAEAVTLREIGGVVISSTRIREHLDDGDVAWAAEALGRPFSVTGPVVRGDGRGRSIGIPTANVEVAERFQIPATGVYAGTATRRAPSPTGHWHCVINVGTRPTFGGTTTTVEAHLLDEDVELYGDHLEVSFAERLRDERRFDGPDELVAQIHRDIEQARQRL